MDTPVAFGAEIGQRHAPRRIIQKRRSLSKRNATALSSDCPRLNEPLSMNPMTCTICPMSLTDQLRESRSKHTLKNYADAVRQLRAFKAVQPITSKSSASSESTQVKEDCAVYQTRSRN